MSAASQLDRDLERLGINVQVHDAMIAQTARIKRDNWPASFSVGDSVARRERQKDRPSSVDIRSPVC
jgi:hypothetical protein